MSEPIGWISSRLRFVASIRNSNVDKKSYDGQRPVLLCNYTDVYYNETITSCHGLMEATASQSEIEKFSLLAGDVIITKDSETANDIGIPAWVPKSLPGVVCGYHLTQLRTNEMVTPEFLFRTLQATTTRQYLEVQTPGVTRFGLDQNTIGSIPVLVPPKELQSAITSYLERETTRIDALVAKKTRFIELLREKRQALITQAVTKGLDPSVPMKDSGVEWLGEVPAHWGVVRGGSVLVEQRAKNDPIRSDYYLSLMANIGIIPYAEKGDVGNKKPDDLTKCKMVSPGDFVINSMNYAIGSYGVSSYAGVCSPVYVVMRHRPEEMDPRFMDLIFSNPSYQNYAQSFGTGILDHRRAIGWDEIKVIRVPLPPIDEQARIAAWSIKQRERVDLLIAKTERSIELLREHRTALITAAVTGKIDLRDAA